MVIEPAADAAESVAPVGEEKPATDATLLAGDTKAETKPDARVDAPLEVKLPEGFKADDASIGKFKTLAKEYGLKGEQAQKVLEVFAEVDKARSAELSASYDREQKSWHEAIKADKEIGGSAMDASVQAANKAVTKFCSPTLVAMFRDTGLGNHPEMVRAFAKIGKAIGEDSLPTSTNGANSAAAQQAKADFYKSMYPNTVFPKE